MFPFFKDRPIGGSLWQRFRAAPEGFTVLHEREDLWEWHCVASAERIVGLFADLLAHLPDTFALEIADAHADKRWAGKDCDRAGVLGALALFRAPLVAHGGVELTVFGDADQITLNPVLELFLYARSERWTEILRDTGLAEERMVRTSSWKLRRSGLSPAPELSAAVARAAESLRLTPG